MESLSFPMAWVKIILLHFGFTVYRRRDAAQDLLDSFWTHSWTFFDVSFSNVPTSHCDTQSSEVEEKKTNGWFSLEHESSVFVSTAII